MNLEYHGTALQRRGGWLEMKTLGSGGFGTVVLWKHEESGDLIALKRCRLQNEMTAKHRDRWKLEIDIMKRLQHENVIKALEVPQALDVSVSEMPLLAMEYCSGGDLRKVLIDAENCCGMREYPVKCLAHDIAAAIEYLHSKRIIHRDLKPENIVLQQMEENVIYKLIDLGYAKELDQGSVCTSFVGTLQYLAPELFASQKYTCSVDYWSFGTVIFECITGYRPFLPALAPVQWHKEIKKKSPDDICAHYDMNGIVQFQKKLPGPNFLCRTMQAYFEQWLKMMLMWLSNQRGGGIEQNRTRCFMFLDNMLNMKIVHILNVASNQILSYPVRDRQTIYELQKIIEQETKIPVQEQDIILASGVTPEPEQPAVQCCSQLTEDDWLVFLFKKGESGIVPLTKKMMKPLPPMAQVIVKEPSTYLAYTEQKRAWAQSVYFCHEQMVDYRRLILGQRASMLSLLRINSIVTKLRTKMLNEFEILLGKIDFFKRSLKHDIDLYKEQAATGVASEKMYKRWNKMEADVEEFLSIKEDVTNADEHSTASQTKIVELQKSPFARDKKNTILEEMKKKSKNLYQDLKQATKDQREGLRDHKPMVQAVVKVVYERDQSLQDLYTHLGKICSCKHEVDQILPKIQQCFETIATSSSKIIEYQHQRQTDVWKLVKVALQQGKQNPGSINRLSSSSGSTEYSSQLSVTNTDSVNAIKDSKDTSLMLDGLFNSICEEIEAGSLTDWNFLPS